MRRSGRTPAPARTSPGPSGPDGHGPAPGRCVIGGDLNVRDPWIEGFLHAAHRSVDHVYATGGWGVAVPGETLDAGGLSDHRPIAVTLRAGDADGAGGTAEAGPVSRGR